MNEKLFKILERMHPGEFGVTSPHVYRDLESITGAFWLADKVGLFENNHSLHKIGKNWRVVHSYYDYYGRKREKIVGKSQFLYVAILKAIIEFFGKDL